MQDGDSRVPVGPRVLAQGQGKVRYLAVAFSPDGAQIVTAAQASNFLAYVDMASVARPDGPFLVETFGRGPSLTLWDATTGRPIRPPVEHPARLLAVGFSPDGSRLVAAGGLKYDPGPRDLLQKIRDASRRREAVIGGLGPWVGDGGGAVRTWGVAKDRELSLLAPRAATIDAVYWGTRFIAAIDRNYVLTLWTPGRDEPSLTIDNIKGAGQGPGIYWGTTNFAFNAAGTRAVAISNDPHNLHKFGREGSALKIWDASRGEGQDVIVDRELGSIHSVALDREGRRFALGNHEGKVTLWDFDGDRPVREFDPPTRKGADFLAFSPDGSWIASGASDGSVSLWDPASGWLIRDYDGPRGNARAVAFLKGTLRVATVSPMEGKAQFVGPEQLKVWDVPLP